MSCACLSQGICRIVVCTVERERDDESAVELELLITPERPGLEDWDESLGRSSESGNRFRNGFGYHDFVECQPLARMGDRPWVLLLVVRDLLRRPLLLMSRVGPVCQTGPLVALAPQGSEIIAWGEHSELRDRCPPKGPRPGGAEERQDHARVGADETGRFALRYPSLVHRLLPSLNPRVRFAHPVGLVAWRLFELAAVGVPASIALLDVSAFDLDEEDPARRVGDNEVSLGIGMTPGADPQGVPRIPPLRKPTRQRIVHSLFRVRLRASRCECWIQARLHHTNLLSSGELSPYSTVPAGVAIDIGIRKQCDFFTASKLQG